MLASEINIYSHIPYVHTCLRRLLHVSRNQSRRAYFATSVSSRMASATMSGLHQSILPALESLFFFSLITHPAEMALLTWLIIALAGLTHCHTFNLLDSFQGLDFFNRAFTLYEGFDPTFGYVDYVSLATAEQNGLINLTEVGNTGIARWGVDTVSILDPNANLGRQSIRLQSVKTYTHGLFILDVARIPANMYVYQAMLPLRALSADSQNLVAAHGLLSGLSALPLLGRRLARSTSSNKPTTSHVTSCRFTPQPSPIAALLALASLARF